MNEQDDREAVRFAPAGATDTAAAANPRPAMVFVGGLHRSGTTPLARWLEQHPDISGLRDTGAPEDEGQHVQDVYPPALEHGGPGRFALDPAAALDETFARPDHGDRLLAAWNRFRDTSAPILLEKSPPNLIRLRYLNAVFPGAKFLVIARNPTVVALATRKWLAATPAKLVENWLAAYETFLAQAPHVPDVRLLRYEDLMADPETVLATVQRWLGVTEHRVAAEAKDSNPGYLEQMSWTTPLRLRRLESRVNRFGYSVRHPAELREPDPEVRELML